MNNPSPFIPQGSLADQKNQARARVKIAVFFVLAVNGIGLMALLMQGCKGEKPAQDADVATNPPPAEATAAAPQDTNPPPSMATSNPPTAAAPVEPVTPTPPPATPTPAPAASDYTIVKNDTLRVIATKNHVTLKALEDANPGIEPTKLKIGQKIHIPAPSAPATAGAPAADSSNGSALYTVKSGDNLIKIASANGVSVKALRSANGLKTDKIVVGQKLKLPAKTTSSPTSMPAAADMPSTTTVSTSTPATTAPGQ